MLAKLPFKLKKRKSIMVAAVCTIATICYLRYRLEPMRIYPLADSANPGNSIIKKQSDSLDVRPQVYDTTVGKSYIIEGYLSDDTAAIKKAILSFLATSSGFNLRSKTIHYGFKFYKVSGKFNKDYVLDWGEYPEVDVNKYEIASVVIHSGILTNIIYYNNGQIIYDDLVLDNGVLIRSKFKDGVRIREDSYLPNGKVVQKDLTDEWEKEMKERY